MGQRLSEAAVRGMSSASPVTLSEEQIALLTGGDIEGLLQFHNSVFGTLVMKDDEDDEDDEDDDHDDDDDDSDDDDDDDEDEDDDEDDDSDKGKGKTKVDPKDQRIKDLSAEARKYRLKNRDYRSRIAELEAELGKTGDDKSKSKEKEAPKENGGMTDRERQLAIQLAFTTDSTHSWKDPKAALKLLNLSDVDIDDEGEVEGMEDAIKQLAESYPFLLAETPDEKKERKGQQQRQQQGRTGQSTSTRRKAAKDRERLIATYNIRR